MPNGIDRESSAQNELTTRANKTHLSQHGESLDKGLCCLVAILHVVSPALIAHIFKFGIKLNIASHFWMQNIDIQKTLVELSPLPGKQVAVFIQSSNLLKQPSEHIGIQAAQDCKRP